MDVKDFCSAMESEMTAWKAKMYDAMRKIDQLTGHNVTVSGREPHIIPPNDHNRFYLETKAKRSGHFIDLDGHPHLNEQSEPVHIAGMPPDE